MASSGHHHGEVDWKFALEPFFCQYWDIFPRATLKYLFSIPLIAPSSFLKGAIEFLHLENYMTAKA